MNVYQLHVSPMSHLIFMTASSQNSANLELMLNLRDAVAYGRAHYNWRVSFVSIFAKGLVLLFRQFYKQLYDILQVAF